MEVELVSTDSYTYIHPTPQSSREDEINLEGFQDAKIPSSVLSLMAEQRDSPFSPLWSSSPSHSSRPFITISHLQGPRSRRPLFNHFNSQGEAFLPQYLPVNNRPEQPHVQKLKRMKPPSVPAHTDVSSSILDVKQANLVNPHSLNISHLKAPDIKPPTERNLSDSRKEKLRNLRTLANVIIPPKWSHSSTSNIPCSSAEPGPIKRQKLSHPQMAKPSPQFIPSQAPDMTMGPNMDKSTIITGRLLKLCSSINCTGTISSNSSATRCLPCVRRDWKTRRNSIAHAQTLPFQGATQRELARKGKKKCVTWEDDLVHSSSPSLRSSVLSNGSIDNNTRNLKFNRLLNDVDHSNDVQKSDIPPAITIKDDTLVAGQPGITLSVNAERSGSVSKVSKGDKTQVGPISGWDSDLSELSDSSEADPDISSPSKSSSGLKIRIPARPAGTCNKKCASRECEEMLKFGDRWKCCMMCRARKREVNRKRHTPVAFQQSLLEVLTDNDYLGTPLSMDLQKHADRVKLVQGARLCAVKRCTYIIPPIEEYVGNKCTFCLLRKAERDHLENEADQRPSRRSKLVSQPSFWLQQLEHNRNTMTDQSGRCPRHGCGMFLSKSSSRECQQCVGRRVWLINKFTGPSIIPDGPVILHHGSRKPLHRPRGMAPYPKFKCFSVTLKEFKDLLTGFLRAQSIFFLFNQPQSSDAFFAFDAEYSTVALDFDLDKRREEVEANILKLKTTFEYVGRINFNPKRLVSILEGGGVSIQFSSVYPVPMLQSRIKDGETIIDSFLKFMQCELEIAIVPDHSHCLIPGQRTIIRFRLFG